MVPTRQTVKTEMSYGATAVTRPSLSSAYWQKQCDAFYRSKAIKIADTTLAFVEFHEWCAACLYVLCSVTSLHIAVKYIRLLYQGQSGHTVCISAQHSQRGGKMNILTG